MYKKIQQEGFSLVELIIAISFVAILVVVILNSGQFSTKIRRVNNERFVALLHTQEAMEATRALDWDDLIVGSYYPALVASNWQLQLGSQLIDNKYTRQLEIEDVYRENQTNGQVWGDIVDAGGYLDPSTKKIVGTVSWSSQAGGSAKQEQLELLIHRWESERWIQTDWSAGPNQTIWQDEDKFFSSDLGIDYTLPGILSLVIGNIDWSNATTTGFYDTPGNFDDNDVIAQGTVAYLVSENNPSGDELYILDTTDLSNPVLMTSLNIGSSLTGVAIRNDVLYLSSADNTEEFKTIDVSDNYAPVPLGGANLPSNSDATDIVVNENEAYLIQADNVVSFSIVDPANPVLLDTLSLSDNGSQMYVAGNYLYIATKDSSAEVQIVNITNPASLQLASTFDLPGSVKANAAYVVGNRAYFSTDNSGSWPEFYILDVSDPLAPTELGSYDVNETVFSLVVIGDFALIGTNFLDEELIILDVSIPATISEVGGFDLLGHILGMSTNCSTIYAATSGNKGEFFIISTGVPDCDISSTGMLESSTFDTGSASVEYDWLGWSETGTTNTIIKVQLATSQFSTGPWNFLGPDGTSGSYYTNAAKEFINYTAHNNQRYARYRVFLDTEAAYDVPVFEEITISYTP